MGWIDRIRNAADHQGDEDEAIKAAMKARGCTNCGRTFSSPGAWQLAHDGRCLPDHVIESALVEISGVWCTRGSDAARR